jgi:hypothetical protein
MRALQPHPGCGRCAHARALPDVPCERADLAFDLRSAACRRGTRCVAGRGQLPRPLGHASGAKPRPLASAAGVLTIARAAPATREAMRPGASPSALALSEHRRDPRVQQLLNDQIAHAPGDPLLASGQCHNCCQAGEQTRPSSAIPNCVATPRTRGLSPPLMNHPHPWPATDNLPSYPSVARPGSLRFLLR